MQILVLYLLVFDFFSCIFPDFTSSWTFLLLSLWRRVWVLCVHSIRVRNFGIHRYSSCICTNQRLNVVKSKLLPLGFGWMKFSSLVCIRSIARRVHKSSAVWKINSYIFLNCNRMSSLWKSNQMVYAAQQRPSAQWDTYTKARIEVNYSTLLLGLNCSFRAPDNS